MRDLSKKYRVAVAELAGMYFANTTVVVGKGEELPDELFGEML